MTNILELESQLIANPKTWLITGVGGFIGSNILETLLRFNQRIVGLDNFSTGHKRNLDEVRSVVTENQWRNFQLIEGDIRNLVDCRNAMRFSSCLQGDKDSHTVDYVLHQAALGSVPRSIVDPVTTNETNINGFLNMLVAARDASVLRFVYAASSSTYGDHPDLPKVETKIGQPLSPYAVTKLVNELYADVFARCFNFSAIGLRYFNVFGQRQDSSGAYSAVIPKWTDALLKGEQVFINGDGETSRDFCYIDNVVLANLLAATTKDKAATNQVYNIALGERTTLTELYELIAKSLSVLVPLPESELIFRDFRAGDVRHSLADISKAKKLLGYDPQVKVAAGISSAMPWYVRQRILQ